MYFQDGLRYHDHLLCDASMDAAARAWRSFMDPPTDSNADGQPPGHPMMDLLTDKQQTDLLKRALAESTKEFRQFIPLPLACDSKRLRGCPALPPTSMPTGSKATIGGGYTVSYRESRPKMRKPKRYVQYSFSTRRTVISRRCSC